eukprot:5797036-Ditylum_brightwellii.AAC.1
MSDSACVIGFVSSTYRGVIKCCTAEFHRDICWKKGRLCAGNPARHQDERQESSSSDFMVG